MVRRSSATRYRQGTRNGGTRRRRRSSLMSRIRHQPPRAQVQKRQITSLARLAMRSSRILAAHRIFQDWKFDGLTNYASNGWTVTPFMNPISWNACLRQDLTPLTQSGCFLRELQFSYFITNNTKTLPSTISLFLVTLRSQQTFSGTMNLNEEYITNGDANQPTLNSGIFSCKWARTFQVFPANQATIGTSGQLLPTGNPNSQYKKGKTTLRLNFRLRSPSDLSWKQLSQEDFPHYQSLYLLAFFQCEDADASNVASLSYGCKTTTITQD